MPKLFDCVDHNKLWKIPKEMRIPDPLICLLRNLYTGQEATVRTGHGTTDCFWIRKGVCQGCILSPCLFNFVLSTSCEMPGWMKHKLKSRLLGEISNLRYADDSTLTAESEEELKNLLMKVKEDSEKAGLKFNIQKMKSMASSPITSWQTDGETMETVRDFIFFWTPKSLQIVTAAIKLKDACSLEGKLWPT